MHNNTVTAIMIICITIAIGGCQTASVIEDRYRCEEVINTYLQTNK